MPGGHRHVVRAQAGADLSPKRSLGAIEGVPERALIVEDDPSVSRAFGRLLESWGVRDVATAATLDSGLADLDPSIGLVLADLGLPDGRGLEVVRAALALDPQPIVIVVSGGWNDDELRQLSGLGVCFVAKPACPHTLRAPLDQLVAARVRNERGLEAAVDDAERRSLDVALAETAGNISRAAELLGVSRQRVQQLMDRHGRPRRDKP